MSLQLKCKAKISSFFRSLVEVDSNVRAKVILLSICFFLVIGGYTLIKELKDSVFLAVVGKESLPLAKMLSMIVLIPMVVLYSKLVDLLRQSDLLCLYALIYSMGGLACVYFLGHPTIGLSNTDASTTRLFGWFFYFFLEGYAPFVVSVLWAFVNSITAPEEIKNNYIIMTASSKLGGATMAGLAWWLLSTNTRGAALFSEVAMYQLLLIIASFILLLVPVVIAYLMKRVPAQYMHGYEAAYRIELKREAIEEKKTARGFKDTMYEMFAGLWLLLRYPYVLGIFGMIFFWEIINVIFNYMRLCVGQAETNSITEFGAFLYQQACFTHIVGFFFVILGTRTIVARLGERRSLIAVPLLIGTVIGCYLAFQSKAAVAVAYVIMRAINYAFAYPLRESLYIPATKAVKFKSKSWIDGFGAKLSKTTGSAYNYLMPLSILSVNIVFFSIVIFAWVIMANALGRRFEKAVKNNEVIGAEG
jgi:AAA family ATP:ADP antiporter